MQRNQSNKSMTKEINIPEIILDNPAKPAFRNFDKNNT